tara:strand:- start:2302 stop:2490 length:189 start_codon:yes stop_codon:yes gene_type:complete
MTEDDIDHVQAVALSTSIWDVKIAAQVAKTMGYKEFEDYRAVYRTGKLAISAHRPKGKIWDD